MLDVAEAIVALLTAAPDITAAAGVEVPVKVAEVWNVGSDAPVPLLSIAFEGRDAPIASSDAGEELVLKCWFEGTTQLQAFAVRDALRKKFSRQESALQRAGVAVNLAVCTASHVGIAPDTGRPQAYVAFRIVT